jgi:hypothetical protein
MDKRLCPMIMMMGWDYFSDLRLQTEVLVIPRWYMSMESYDGVLSTREYYWFVHQSSLAILTAESSNSKIRRGLAKDVMNSAFEVFVHTEKWHLRYGANGFKPTTKEGVLRIFIALKYPLPRRGLNLQTLGPMANTLTTTRRRWQYVQQYALV